MGTEMMAIGRGLAAVEEFKKVTEPVVRWLQENGNPHQKIIIEQDGAEMASGEMAYHVDVPD